MYDELFTGRSVQLREDEDQGELILAAQAGDEHASWRLLQTYAPLMRKTVRAMTRENVTDDELADRRGTAVESVLQAIRDCDPARLDTFGGLVKMLLRRNLMDGSRDSGVAMVVPDTQRRAYFEALDKAGGDFDKAAELAVASGAFRSSTFLAVHAALTTSTIEREAKPGRRANAPEQPDDTDTDRLDTAAPLWEQADPAEVAEARMLATQALAALEGDRELTQQIVALHYGLDGDGPLSDVKIGERFGLHHSTVQKLRAKALVNMRESLGLNADGSEAEL